jgi:ubiquinone biosynthesis accessory factor UbiJ
MTKHDPALIGAALAGAERALNQAIRLAPTSHRGLEGLVGTRLGMEISSFDLTLFVEIVTGPEVRLMNHCEAPTAAFVRGSIEDFASLATSDDPAAVLINSGIELEGSSASLITLQQVISRIEIDWEAPLVDALGDVVGHQIAETIRGIFRWGEGARISLTRQLSEYLLEEGKLTPPQAELDHFFDAVQSVSMRVERAQHKVAKLLAKAADRRTGQ